MKMNQTILASAALAGFTFATTTASAQDISASADAEMDAEATEEETADPEPMMEEPMDEPMEEVEEVAEEMAEEESEGGAPFLFAFADAYAAFQTTKSGDFAGGGVYSSVGPDGTAQSGFGMNWLGIDLGYDSEKWGFTGSIRAGDAVYQYGVGTLGGNGTEIGNTGIGITNAYATWKPVDGLALDVGTFGTIYGAEVAESWNNLNYTRGELYFNYQPFWHTGLRAEYATGDLVFRGLVTNVANSSTLGNYGMDLGLQAGYDNGTFGIVGGVLQSLAPESRGAAAGGQFLDTFIDVVVTAGVGGFSLVGNFDMNLGYSDYSAGFFGGSLAVGYAFSDAFGVALRGEYLGTSDGALGLGAADGEESLITGTLTLDTKPTGSENFVVRWDNRVELASEDIFVNLAGDDVSGTWFSSTLGFVAYADLL